MNIEYHGCDVESIYGDIFQIGVDGGGRCGYLEAAISWTTEAPSATS